jgi:hypothetical protein
MDMLEPSRHALSCRRSKSLKNWIDLPEKVKVEVKRVPEGVQKLGVLLSHGL